MILPMLARVLRLASIAICLIAIASFVAFALERSSSASSRQQAKVNEAAPADLRSPLTQPSKSGHKSGLHEAIDSAFSALSSPFASVTAGSSQWTIQIVDTLLILLVYGFGLGFLARLLPRGL